MVKRIIFIVVFFLSWLLVAASDGRLNYNNYRLISDLPSSRISDIVQDKYGFIWIASLNGLSRFDGYSIKTYTKLLNNPNCLCDNIVLNLYIDSYDELWIGTSSGFCKYNSKRDNFTHYPQEEFQTGSSYITEFYEDRYGDLFVVVDDGKIYKYDRKLNTFNISYNFNRRIKDYIYDSTSNRIFFGNETKIYIFDLYDSTLTLFGNHKQYKSYFKNIIINSMFLDKYKLWIGTKNSGVIKYDIKNGEFKSYKLNINEIDEIYKTRSGILMLGSSNGLFVYNKKKKNFFKTEMPVDDEFLLKELHINAIYEDNLNNLWLGIFFKGALFLFNNKAFKNYTSSTSFKTRLTGNIVSGIYSDKRNNTWIGYYNNGIDKVNAKGKVRKIEHFPKLASTGGIGSVFCFAELPDSSLYVGKHKTGLQVYNGNDRSFYPCKIKLRNGKELKLNDVRSIDSDSEGNLWIGTQGQGLIKYNPITKEGIQLLSDNDDITSLPSNWIFDVFVDTSDRIMVATSDGLAVMRGEYSFTQIKNIANKATSISSNKITTIFKDSKNRVWIGTREGLNLYNSTTGTFVRYYKKDGLSSNYIAGILEDNSGNLWISTSKGLTKFSPESGTFVVFTQMDGLISDEFLANACTKSITGELYFGNSKGYIRFHPDSIKKNPLVPPVYITSIKVFNKELHIDKTKKYNTLKEQVLHTKKLLLDHNHNSISFEFVSLNYINYKKNQFAYKLQGFDEKWNYVGEKHKANYINLDPGKYSFKVIASNNDGVWNTEGTSIDLEILPPFWKTWWFTVFEVMSVICISILFFYLRSNKLLKEKRILNERIVERTHKINQQKLELDEYRLNLEKQVEKRTNELLKAKERAEESEKLKSSFLANMSHEIRTPMNAIVGFSELLTDFDVTEKEKQTYLSLINSNSQGLLRLIDDILDFSLIEANKIIIENSGFHLNSLIDNVYSMFSLINNNSAVQIIKNNELEKENLFIYTDRQRLLQIICNLMNNACKFTNTGKITVGANKEKDKIMFYVEDTGIGISEKDKNTIFQQFRKINDSYTNSVRGVGLGLTISKRLSGFIGGKLTFESHLNLGSKFMLTFSDKIITTEKDKRIKSDSDIFKIDNMWSNKNMLIVEDEMANYLYLKKILSKTNISISWAQNGLEALEHVKNTDVNFDVVLMDIKMPKMDGFEATRLLRIKYPDLVIIAETAYARPEDEAKIRTKGFNDYISKPIDKTELLKTLQKYI